MPTFRICNVQCETGFTVISSFTSSFYAKFKSTSPQQEPRIPMIDIFGITDSGEKCVIHVHGCLPYLLMRTREPYTSEVKRQVGRIVVRCAQLIGYEMQAGKAILYDVVPEQLIDVYGYHPSADHFVRVIFFDPSLCHRVGLTLQKECPKNCLLQPYLTHIPYLLQFFIDYNVSGMGYVSFKQVSFRRSTSTIRTQFGSDYNDSKLQPLTTMPIEADVMAADIITTKTASEKGSYVCNGLEAIWREEEHRCNIRQMTLHRPSRPEAGIPVRMTKEETGYLREYRKLISPDGASQSLSQSFASQRAPQRVFQSQAVIQNDTTREEIEKYISTETQSGEKVERLYLYDEPEDEEDVEPEVIVIDDSDDEDTKSKEPVVIDLTGDTDDEEPEPEAFEIEPDWPPVLMCPGESQSPYSLPTAPSSMGAETWCADDEVRPMNQTLVFEIESPTKITATQKEASDLFKNSIKLSSVSSLCVMSIEIIAVCNDEPSGGVNSTNVCHDKKFLPTFNRDSVAAIFYTVYDDVCNQFRIPATTGAITVSGLNLHPLDFPNVTYAAHEKEIFSIFSKVLISWNPDIIVGYDIDRLSFGYLLQRSKHLQLPFISDTSRVPIKNLEYIKKVDDLKGRIFLNVWKVIRRENPLRHYRMSAVVSEIMNRRFPEFSQYYVEKTLRHNQVEMNGVIFRHFFRKSNLSVQLLVALDIFIKTSQMARVYGIQFCEVLTRGSQFRVESMLLRIAREFGYCAPSVGVLQRNAMPSPETIPLNLEPKSGIYYDPVVVLDFQSLYPSVCIAHNYCFSTCLGSLREWKKSVGPFNIDEKIELLVGALPFTPPELDEIMALHRAGQLTISPVGGIFVKKETRKSLLAVMLEELLETRVMVKSAMKGYKDDVIKRLLEARQLALKLIANVTYGYTAANWSGRMPCSDVADAIVSKGREALEDAIQMIKNDSRTTRSYRGAEVIYGDTDSLFILFRGLSRADAFVVGRQIAADVTARNPYPMKLKFEKVMMPCCLIAKKRYVGMSYEEESATEGIFDAKGIEAIRRDSCPFVAHTMESVLRQIFDGDINSVIGYLKYKIQTVSSLPLSQFVLSGDYKPPYSDKSKTPTKKVAQELSALSPAHTPVYGERLEYIVAQPPRQLVQQVRGRRGKAGKQTITVHTCVMRLQNFIETPQMQIFYDYYVRKKLMPALARVFQLIPLKVKLFPGRFGRCPGCFLTKASSDWCAYCRQLPESMYPLLLKASRHESHFLNSEASCRSCIGIRPSYRCKVPCYNIHCSVWQTRLFVERFDDSEKHADSHLLAPWYNGIRKARKRSRIIIS